MDALSLETPVASRRIGRRLSNAPPSGGAVAPELANPRLSSDLLFTSDAEIHSLNRGVRQRDRPTTCCRSRCWRVSELLELGPEGPPVLLGDIALAPRTCAREAAERRPPARPPCCPLVIHA